MTRLDPWVPRYRFLDNFFNGDHENLQNVMVNSLINGDERWDSDLINTLFNPQIIREIYKIRLGSLHQKDIWIWTIDRRGNLSVRSAYKFFNNLQRELRGETSLAHVHNRL